MELLNKAVQTGFRDAKFLQGEVFDPLRERADFQRLVRQLAASGRGAGPSPGAVKKQ